jgi:hypothetical protein
MIIRIRQSDLDEWSRAWPCSTLETGWAEFDDRNGDLVDLGGKLACADVDARELTAFCDDRRLRHGQE